MTRGKHVEWQPEELELLFSTPWGETPALCRKIRRAYQTVIAKRHNLRQQAKLRQECGAFLPDNGVPYRAVMMRLLRQP